VILISTGKMVYDLVGDLVGDPVGFFEGTFVEDIDGFLVSETVGGGGLVGGLEGGVIGGDVC